jgi:hypothetical protein
VELSDRSLEAELAAIAEHAEPGRTARLALRHWGWDGRGGATLRATGREREGITRERVRQLCQRLSEKLAGHDGGAVAAPSLDRALLLAARTAPTTAHALARRLVEDRIAAQPFDPAGLLVAAKRLGRDATFTLHPVKNVRMVLPNPPDPTSDTAAVIASIIDTSRALVRRSGAARIGDVTGKVAAGLAVWVDDGLVTAVVSEADDFSWLERRSGWFFLPSVAKNAVVSRLHKILSLTGTARLDDLHAGIRRDERMREFVMPEYILAELCDRLPGVSVSGDVVISRPRRAPEDTLEGTELTLFRALRSTGGEADRHELERLCRAAGMKASSFANRVAYSPIIRTAGQGRYGLRGLPAEADRGAGPGTAAGPALPTPPRISDETPRPGDISHFRSPQRR